MVLIILLNPPSHDMKMALINSHATNQPKIALINSNTVLVQTRDGGIYAIQVK